MSRSATSWSPRFGGPQTGMDTLQPWIELYNASGRQHRPVRREDPVPPARRQRRDRHARAALGRPSPPARTPCSASRPTTCARAISTTASSATFTRAGRPRPPSTSRRAASGSTARQYELAAEGRHVLARLESADRRRERHPDELVHRHDHERRQLPRHAAEGEHRMSMTTRLLVFSCALAHWRARPVGGKRYTRKQAQKSLLKLETPGIVVGEFHADEGRRRRHVQGRRPRQLAAPARRSTPRRRSSSEGDRRAYAAGWHELHEGEARQVAAPGEVRDADGRGGEGVGEAVLRGRRQGPARARSPAEIRDRYNRYLAYVFVAEERQVGQLQRRGGARRDGAVLPEVRPRRAGSTTSSSQARPRRRRRKRGIWAPGDAGVSRLCRARGVVDARAASSSTQFREEGEGKAELHRHHALGRDAAARGSVGKEVHVLGTVGDVPDRREGPRRA